MSFSDNYKFDEVLIDWMRLEKKTFIVFSKFFFFIFSIFFCFAFFLFFRKLDNFPFFSLLFYFHVKLASCDRRWRRRRRRRRRRWRWRWRRRWWWRNRCWALFPTDRESFFRVKVFFPGSLKVLGEVLDPPSTRQSIVLRSSSWKQIQNPKVQSDLPGAYLLKKLFELWLETIF